MTVISYPLEVGSWVTRCLQAGHGDRTVVFLHGGVTNAERWMAALDRIGEAGFRALAVDLPGRGFCLQGEGEPPVGVGGLGEFVCSFLDTMELKRVAVVGASFGGHLAAAVAVNYPERVEQLTLIGPVGLTPWSRAARAQLWDDNLQLTRDQIAAGLARQRRQPPAWFEVERNYRMRTTTVAVRTAKRIAAYMTADEWESDYMGDRLGTVAPEVPVLVIWGREDRLLPVADAYTLQKSLPGSTLAVVEEAEHDADLDRPDAVHSLIVDALRGDLVTRQYEGIEITTMGRTNGGEEGER